MIGFRPLRCAVHVAITDLCLLQADVVMTVANVPQENDGKATVLQQQLDAAKARVARANKQMLKLSVSTVFMRQQQLHFIQYSHRHICQCCSHRLTNSPIKACYAICTPCYVYAHTWLTTKTYSQHAKEKSERQVNQLTKDLLTLSSKVLLLLSCALLAADVINWSQQTAPSADQEALLKRVRRLQTENLKLSGHNNLQQVRLHTHDTTWTWHRTILTCSELSTSQN